MKGETYAQHNYNDCFFFQEVVQDCWNDTNIIQSLNFSGGCSVCSISFVFKPFGVVSVNSSVKVASVYIIFPRQPLSSSTYCPQTLTAISQLTLSICPPGTNMASAAALRPVTSVGLPTLLEEI